MAHNKLFVDSDVILDMVLKRYPFYAHSVILFVEAKSRNIDIYTSTLVIANINYLISKQAGKSAALEAIRNLVQDVKLLPFEADIIASALKEPSSDFEDTIQQLIANKYNCDYIITRNLKDYQQSTIPVLTAEQFLRTLA